MNAPADLSICRLHARGVAREPVIARLACDVLAAALTDRLPDVPLAPQSVLLLRRLTMMLPGRTLDRLPDARLRHAVASMARQSIADAAARAARPACGPVPPDAPAVLFGDPAELLACLARDGLAGQLDTWWWRQWLGDRAGPWHTLWQTRADAVPAVWRLLDRAGLVAPMRALLAPPCPSRHAPVTPSPTGDLPSPPVTQPATDTDARVGDVPQPTLPRPQITRPAPAALARSPASRPPGAAPSVPTAVAASDAAARSSDREPPCSPTHASPRTTRIVTATPAEPTPDHSRALDTFAASSGPAIPPPGSPSTRTPRPVGPTALPASCQQRNNGLLFNFKIFYKISFRGK